MATITGTLGRPIQGISQQPNNNRLDGQCTASVNFRPDIVKGLTTRSGSKFIRKLDFKAHERDEWVYYKRDEVEEYFINISQDPTVGITIVDKHGVTQTLDKGTPEYTEAAAYLYNQQSGLYDVRNKLASTTIADTTILANKDVVVKQDPSKTPKNKNQAILHVTFADYGQEFSVDLDGARVAAYVTPDGSSPDHKRAVDTSKVAEKIYEGLTAGSGQPSVLKSVVLPVTGRHEYYLCDRTTLPSTDSSFYHSIINERTLKSVSPVSWSWVGPDGRDYVRFRTGMGVGDNIRFSWYEKTDVAPEKKWVVTLDANMIYLKKVDDSDFTVKLADGADGRNFVAVKDSVTDISQLPPRAPSDMVVKVIPKNGSEAEVYYLKSVWQDEDGTKVQWTECPEPDLPVGLDSLTMPVSLVRESYSGGKGVFKLERNTYDGREVGNMKTNRDPAFVGSSISAVSLFQNRLLMASGDTISTSRSGEFWNFFRTTTQSVLDTDPYEVFSDSTSVISLRDPVNFNGDLTFFSDTAQVTLDGGEVVSPNKLSPLRLASSFEVQAGARPVAAGENIFFPFDFGSYTGIREYFVDSVTDTKRARPITDHVNQLIQGEVRHMASSTSINALIVQGRGEGNVLYVYDWMWQGADKVQSAWGVWKLPEGCDILHFEFSGSDLYVIFNKGDHTYMVTIDMGSNPDTIDVKGVDVAFCLDLKSTVKASKVSSTTWSIPTASMEYLKDYPESDIRGVLASGYPDDIGTEVILSMNVDGSWTVNDTEAPDGQDSIDVLVGVKLKALYTPSNPYPKDQDGSARSDLDRLQIGRLFVNYDKAGFCYGDISRPLREPVTRQLSPRNVGSNFNLIGFAPVNTGQFIVGVRTKANQYVFTLTTESHIPLQLREIEFDGTYFQRRRTI